MTNNRSRLAFTAIEMVTVLTVMIILTGMAVPALMPSIRKARVNEGAEAITAIASQARALARGSAANDTQRYGVVVVNDAQGSWAAVTYGATASQATVLDAANGKRPLGANVTVTMPTAAHGWMYQNRSGMLYGTAPFEQVTVRSLDASAEGRYRKAVAVYYLGYSHAQDM
ncbi:MAG: type II secretion system protein [Planctomycetes bacterium]|nr:type II secretion system protein [Planctomycetota bacterium]